MASSSSPSKAMRTMTRSQRMLREKSHEPAQTPAIELKHKDTNSTASISGLPDGELMNTFKSDLSNIRGLVTCTICDQLLYEPWTLGCGHTYCYSCLSSWFNANKRNKTCPDCRQAVRNRPAPSFLIKQLVETFINREELMPADESPSQHRTRQKEENEIVENDKSNPTGLFKGCFDSKKRRHITIDHADGVRRCPECLWEYEGGTQCEQCGLVLGGSDLDSLEDFSEGDEDEVLYDLELNELDADFDSNGSDADGDDIHMGRMGFFPPILQQRHQLRLLERQAEVLNRHDQRRMIERRHGLMGNRVPSESDDSIEERMMHTFRARPRGYSSDSIHSEGQSDEEEETESMRDFIANDESGFSIPYIDENTYQESHSSGNHDEDEDEDDDESADDEIRRAGPAFRPRPRRNAAGVRNNVIVLDSSDSDDEGTSAWPHEADADETALMNNGWSPLDHGNDSDGAADNGPGELGSDTDTLGRDQDGDIDEDDGSRESTPRRRTFQSAPNPRGQHQNFFTIMRRASAHPQSVSSPDVDELDEDEEDSGDDNEQQQTNLRDSDGDVEMSVSPMVSNITDDSESDSEVPLPRTRQTRSRSTRPAVQVTDLTGESSDESVRPAPRRRRQNALQLSRSGRNYSPQISQLFRQYQSEVRDAVAQSAPVNSRLDITTRRATPASRSRTTHYRVLPSRRVEYPVVRDVSNALDRHLF